MASAPRLLISEFFKQHTDLKEYLTIPGRANCNEVNFSKKDLAGARFSHSDFLKAVFTEAILKSVCFKGANINQAVFTRAKKLKTDQLVDAQFAFLKADDEKTRKKINKACAEQLKSKIKIWQKTMQLIKCKVYADLETFIQKTNFEHQKLLCDFLEFFPERESSCRKYIEDLKFLMPKLKTSKIYTLN